MISNMKPYITPEKLLLGKTLPIECDIAIVCLCPMPTYFEQFKSDKFFNITDRLFVQLHSIITKYGFDKRSV